MNKEDPMSAFAPATGYAVFDGLRGNIISFIPHHGNCSFCGTKTEVVSTSLTDADLRGASICKACVAQCKDRMADNDADPRDCI